MSLEAIFEAQNHRAAGRSSSQMTVRVQKCYKSVPRRSKSEQHSDVFSLNRQHFCLT